MTREEAIERLENHTQYKCGGEDLVALNMAIQALKQEPIYYPPCQDCHTKMNEIVRAYNNMKSCDDCVSREEAIKAIDSVLFLAEYSFYLLFGNKCTEALKLLPSVQPKRDKGDKE